MTLHTETTPQEICILAPPRSGTNYVCSLWWSISRHWCFYEIFHPEAVYGAEDFVEKINPLVGFNADTIHSKALVDYARGNPVEFLDLLSRQVANRGLESFSYKIFPEHLNPHDLNRIIQRKTVQVVLIERNPIDVYISRKKAFASGHWTNVSTTDLSIRIDLQEFVDWHSKTAEWLKQVRRMLKAADKTPLQLRYETDILCQPVTHLELVYQHLFTADRRPSEITVREDTLLSKQDLSSSYDQKVLNWMEFCNQVRDRDMLDSFFVY